MEIEIKEWKEVYDKVYQETHSFPLMMEKVKKESYITFVGVPGSGKTTTAQHIALKLQQQGYEIVPLGDVKKLEDYSNPDRLQVFVLDDVVGTFGLHETYYEPLERPDIQRFITEPCKRETKILMTSRHTIFKKLFSRNSFLAKDENVINLCDRQHELNENDKQIILKTYGIDVQCLSVRFPKPFSAMFPLICSLLSKKQTGNEDSSYRASDFLVSPFSYIEKELNELKNKSEMHYATLILCMMSKIQCLSESTLSSETFRKIKDDVLRSCKVDSFTDTWRFMDSLSEMEGTYTIRRGNSYTFIHDSMFEIVAYHYGRKHPEQILKYMSLDYIENYVKLEEILYTRQKVLPDTNERRVENEFSEKCLIKLENKDFPFLAERIFLELKETSIQFSDYITSTLKNPTIKNYFVRLLQGLSLDELESVLLSRQYVRIRNWRLRNLHYSLLQCTTRGESNFLWEDVNFFPIYMSQICETRAWLLYDGHFDMLQCILNQYEKECLNVAELWTKIAEREKRRFHEDEEQARLLMLGCCSGNNQLVKMLISHMGKTAINTGCHCGRPMTPLSFACENGNIDVVQELLINGADVNRKYEGGRVIFRSPYIPLSKYTSQKLRYDKYWVFTPLTAACTTDNLVIIDEVLEKGANIDLLDGFRGEGGNTPLSTACMYGNEKVVEKLLERGANINLTDGNGNSPLTTAIMFENENVINQLLSTTVDVNLYEKQGKTPMTATAGTGLKDLVKELHSLGACINQQDGNGLLPLTVACDLGNAKVMKKLLYFGADVHKEDSKGNAPLCMTCQGGHISMTEILLKFGANVNVIDGCGKTPFTAACRSGNMNIVKTLLNSGADANKTDSKGNAPLSIACQKGHTNLLEILVQNGANIYALDDCGNMPLTAACRSGNTDMVRKILSLGADVNKKDAKGYVPLSIVCRTRHVSLVEVLVQSGANVNLLDGNGNTPLTTACRSGNTDIVERLLRWKVDVNKEDVSGNAPIHIACGNDDWKIVNVLLQEGASINQRDRHGNTPLIRACMFENLKRIRKLIDLKADVNLPDVKERTPLIISCQKRNLNAVEYLLHADLKCNAPLSSVLRNGHLDWKTVFTHPGVNWKTAISLFDLTLERPIYGFQSIINIRDKFGNTPLTVACKIGEINLVETLLSAGANPNLSNVCGPTPLNIAHENGHIPIVELLLEHGGDCKMNEFLFRKDFFTAIVNNTTNTKNRLMRINNRFKPHSGNLLLFHTLINLGGNFVQLETTDTKTFRDELWKAVCRSDCCLLKYLVSIGFDINKEIQRYDEIQQDNVTEPLLHALINMNQHEYGIKYRIDEIAHLAMAGVDVFAQKDANSPEYGVRYRINKIRYLLEAGIDVYARKVYKTDWFSVCTSISTAVMKKKIDKFTGDMSVVTRTNHLKELYSKSVRSRDKELAKEYNTCLLEIKKYARRHSI